MGLDGLEIVMEWEEVFGVAISNDEAFAIRTPRMAIDLLVQKLGAVDDPRRGCLTLRAFNRLRASVESVAMINRRNFRPAARLKDLVDRKQWDVVRATCGIDSLPKLGGWWSPRTVGELTHWTLIHANRDLKRLGEPWSRSEIRSIVRAVIAEVTRLEEFGDDDEFVKDLGIG